MSTVISGLLTSIGKSSPDSSSFEFSTHYHLLTQIACEAF